MTLLALARPRRAAAWFLIGGLATAAAAAGDEQSSASGGVEASAPTSIVVLDKTGPSPLQLKLFMHRPDAIGAAAGTHD